MLLCPYCQGPAKPLPTLNSVSFIDFFQCEGCAKISERPKATAGDPHPLLVRLSIVQQRAPSY